MDQRHHHGQEITETVVITEGNENTEVVYRVQLEPRTHVTFDANVVDNEHLNRKKSKKCCIFHKKRDFGESSSESENSEDENHTSHHSNCKKHHQKKKIISSTTKERIKVIN